MTQQINSATDLNSVVEGWEYRCPVETCQNRTCRVLEESERLKVSTQKGESRYLIVRVLECEHCALPLVLGTHVYHNQEKGWGARGETMTASDAEMTSRVSIMSTGTLPYQPVEYLAFTEPVQKRPLKKV